MKLQFTLIENAKDSLAHAVDHLTQAKPTTGDYKRAILDLSHAIELLLKERVRRIHPAFVWRDIDRYKSIDAPTIGAEEAIGRLMRLQGIALPDKFLRAISSCRKARNKIEHFEFEMDEKEARVIVGRILSLIFHFSKTYLDLDFESDFRKDDTWKALIDIYEFFEEHSKLLEEELRGKKIPVLSCPSCNAETFEIPMSRCKFCGHSEEVVECESCHGHFFESETETLHGADEDMGDFTYILCRDCIKSEQESARAADMMDAWYRSD